MQRRSEPGSTARRSAEYQRFSSCASARSEPLQQIRTTCAAADPGRGAAGSDGDRGGCSLTSRGAFRIRECSSNRCFREQNAHLECEVHVSASSGARRGAPLWQISTRPRPEPSHQPHQPHHAPAHPRHYNDPSPRTVAPGRLFGGRWCGGGTRTVARGEEGSLPPGNARRRSPNNLPRRNSPQVQSTPLIPPFPGCGSRRERSTCRSRLTPPAPGARIPDPRAPG